MPGRTLTVLCALLATRASEGRMRRVFDDSSELFQSSARLIETRAAEMTEEAAATVAVQTMETEKEEVIAPVRKMREAIEKMEDLLKEQVAEITREAIKDELLASRKRAPTTAPVEEVPAPPAQAAPEVPAPPAPEQAAVLKEKTEEELAREKAAEKKHAKYGEDVNLRVRLPSGREMSATFHSATRLQAFMHSICNKAEVPFGETKFFFKGKEVDPMTTPEELGLINDDVLEAQGPKLTALFEAEQEAERRAEEMAAKRALEAQLEAKAASEREEQRQRERQQEELAAAEEKRKQSLKAGGRTVLHFVEENANVEGQSLYIAAKYDNWLQGTMELVTRRLGADPAKTRFLTGENRAEIHPHDSVKTLNLKDGAKIVVKTPFKKKLATVARVSQDEEEEDEKEEEESKEERKEREDAEDNDDNEDAEE